MRWSSVALHDFLIQKETNKSIVLSWCLKTPLRSSSTTSLTTNHDVGALLILPYVFKDPLGFSRWQLRWLPLCRPSHPSHERSRQPLAERRHRERGGPGPRRWDIPLDAMEKRWKGCRMRLSWQWVSWTFPKKLPWNTYNFFVSGVKVISYSASLFMRHFFEIVTPTNNCFQSNQKRMQMFFCWNLGSIWILDL